jgi:hypothetical protein
MPGLALVRAIALGLLISSWLVGCARPASQQEPLEVLVERLLPLPGAQGANHAPLQQELTRLAQHQQLPAQLPAIEAAQGVPYESFIKAYPSLTRAAVRQEVNALWPQQQLRLEPGALEKVRELVTQQGAARHRFAAAVATLSGRPQLRPAQSLLTDDEWCEALTTGCRVEALAAAEILAEQQPAEAIRPLAQLFLVSQQLAVERNLNARLAAAAIRADACQVLSAIANHRATDASTLEALRKMLVEHTSHWPSDQQALVGEQAQGLLLFELVRAGRFEGLVDPQTRQDWDRRGIARTTFIAAQRQLDADEHFFLVAMKQSLAVADKPFFERQAALEALETELESRYGSSEYPLVSGQLLLGRLAEVHRTLAEDRSRCEAWLIALSSASNSSPAVLPLCPLTGQPYGLTQDREKVVVTGCPTRGGEQFEVHRPGTIQARRRAAGFELAPAQIR